MIEASTFFLPLVVGATGPAQANYSLPGLFHSCLHAAYAGAPAVAPIQRANSINFIAPAAMVREPVAIGIIAFQFRRRLFCF
jgi:hypothetical protein